VLYTLLQDCFPAQTPLFSGLPYLVCVSQSLSHLAALELGVACTNICLSSHQLSLTCNQVVRQQSLACPSPHEHLHCWEEEHRVPSLSTAQTAVTYTVHRLRAHYETFTPQHHASQDPATGTHQPSTSSHTATLCYPQALRSSSNPSTRQPSQRSYDPLSQHPHRHAPTPHLSAARAARTVYSRNRHLPLLIHTTHRQPPLGMSRRLHDSHRWLRGV
jgi:hypothetical protein